MLSMSEKELIEGAKKRDPRCQRALFDRYATTLMGVCLRYCRNQVEAEDALQESFIRIFDKLKLYDYKGSFEGWMRRLTVNVALKGYQRKRFTHEQSGLEAIPDQPSDPSAYARLGEQELLKLVAALPEGYRMVFNLYAIEGYSHKEVANMMKISEGTSKSQLFHAKKKLKNQLRAWGIER